MAYDSILIANRGEIAVRIAGTARSLGYRTVAVYSDADAEALHVLACDEAVHIGPADPSASYLNAEAILEAARRSGAGAVHPGYGFLSENPGFARAVQEAGLVWIGPPADAIEAMGDKARSKARMEEAGVPCVPGFRGDTGDAALIEAAEAVGYPLLVKASAGGGGRGMRAVRTPDDLAGAIAAARAEAANAFGDDTLLLERLVEDARHVEVQVFADAHGHVVHLFERDCSVQRRHQKVVEEAPCPTIAPGVRERMGEAACAAARAVGYVGAGTVEFLLAGDDFYFLEMNTRLQVEHPVTEEVTGLDLVELQLAVAAGEELPFAQEDLVLGGHAIEARLYAEDPSRGYLPQPGDVLAWEPPPGVRVDHGLRSPGQIPASYDPMVAKLIAWGPDRETARRLLLRALEETVLAGVRTNRALLTAVLRHDDFVSGAVSTRWLDAHPELQVTDGAVPVEAAVGAWLGVTGGDGFRLSHRGARPRAFAVDGERVVVQVESRDGAATVNGTAVTLRGAGVRRRLRVDGHERAAQVVQDGDAVLVRMGGAESRVAPWVPDPTATSDAADGTVRMPMAGKVLSVEVTIGQAVTADTVVARVEAMKLETPLVAGVDGEVTEVLVDAGDAVAAGGVLVVVG